LLTPRRDSIVICKLLASVRDERRAERRRRARCSKLRDIALAS